jgi:hypothetical protein
LQALKAFDRNPANDVEIPERYLARIGDMPQHGEMHRSFTSASQDEREIVFA